MVTMVQLRDMETFEPSTAEEAEDWFQRFEGQLKTDNKVTEDDKFEHFLRYANSTMRAYAQLVKNDCKILSDKDRQALEQVQAANVGKKDEEKAALPTVEKAFNFETFKRKILSDIDHLTGSQEGGSEIVFTPGSDPMGYYFRKLNQIKKRNPKASFYDIERKIRAGLPREMLFYISPATSEEALKHNLKIGYQNYVNASLGASHSVMMVNKLMENLDQKIKDMGRSGKKALKQKGEQLICSTLSEEAGENKLYPDLSNLSKSEGEPSAPPDYSQVMLTQRDNRNNSRNSQGPRRDNRPPNQSNQANPNQFDNRANYNNSNYQNYNNAGPNWNDGFRNDNRRSYNPRFRPPIEEVTCYRCLEKGHYSTTCRAPKPKNDQRRY